jgi:hypothetical protein
MRGLRRVTAVEWDQCRVCGWRLGHATDCPTREICWRCGGTATTFWRLDDGRPVCGRCIGRATA